VPLPDPDVVRAVILIRTAVAILIALLAYNHLWPNVPGVTYSAWSAVPTLLLVALSGWLVIAALTALRRAGKLHDRGQRRLAWGLGLLSGEPAASRPLFVGLEQSDRAFSQARGRPVTLDLTTLLDRPFTPRSLDDAVVCAPPGGRGTECTIRDHGLWVGVREVALSAAGDSATMRFAVSWAGPEIRERASMQSFVATLYLARAAGGWKVVRRGPFAVS
jgi:hypothetical protein